MDFENEIKNKKNELSFLKKIQNKTPEDIVKIENLTIEIKTLEEESQKQNSIKAKFDSNSKNTANHNNQNDETNIKSLKSIQDSTQNLITDLEKKGLLKVVKDEKFNNSKYYEIKDKDSCHSLVKSLNEVYTKLEEKGLYISQKSKKVAGKEIHGFICAFPKEYKGTKDIFKISEEEIKQILEINLNNKKLGKETKYEYLVSLVGDSNLIIGQTAELIKKDMKEQIASRNSSQSNQIQ